MKLFGSGIVTVKACETENCGQPMSYIDGNLLEGEHVVYRTRPHWLLFIMPVLFTVVVLLPIAWLLANGAWNSFAWIPLALGYLSCLPPLSNDKAPTSPLPTSAS